MEFVFAYVDPASAGLIAQAVVAGLVAIPILLRSKISAGARAVRRSLSRDREEVPTPDQTRR